jgi:hypothetical protein
MPVITFTAEEARTFRAARDGDVRQLSRKSKTELQRIAAGLRAGVGWERIYSQASKDELICEILRFRYPAEKLNETTHVLYHKPGETWSACVWCHPHQGSTCECSLRAPASAS